MGWDTQWKFFQNLSEKVWKTYTNHSDENSGENSIETFKSALDITSKGFRNRQCHWQKIYLLKPKRLTEVFLNEFLKNCGSYLGWHRRKIVEAIWNKLFAEMRVKKNKIKIIKTSQDMLFFTKFVQTTEEMLMEQLSQKFLRVRWSSMQNYPWEKCSRINRVINGKRKI